MTPGGQVAENPAVVAEFLDLRLPRTFHSSAGNNEKEITGLMKQGGSLPARCLRAHMGERRLQISTTLL
jgi:hypothetical protein